jgi:hypothetical protein
MMLEHCNSPAVDAVLTYPAAQPQALVATLSCWCCAEGHTTEVVQVSVEPT